MRIAVLGVGLIGGSIGLAARERAGAEVVGWGPRRATLETAYRFTLDLTAVPVLKELSHLPVIVDPSHAAGRRDLVEPLSLAAAAAGADGIIVEVHPDPEQAICDGPQALRADDFAAYAARVQAAAAVAGKAAFVDA